MATRKLGYTEIGHNKHSRLWVYTGGKYMEFNAVATHEDLLTEADKSPSVWGRIDPQRKRISLSAAQTPSLLRTVEWVKRKLARQYPGYRLYSWLGWNSYSEETL